MRQVVTLLFLLDLTPTSDKRLFAIENAPIRCKNRPYIKGNKKIKVKKNCAYQYQVKSSVKQMITTKSCERFERGLKIKL